MMNDAMKKTEAMVRATCEAKGYKAQPAWIRAFWTHIQTDAGLVTIEIDGSYVMNDAAFAKLQPSPELAALRCQTAAQAGSV